MFLSYFMFNFFKNMWGLECKWQYVLCRVTSLSNGCTTPVLGIVILSVLTVDTGDAGVGRGAVHIRGQGTGRCTGSMAVKSFYWTMYNPPQLDWNSCNGCRHRHSCSHSLCGAHLPAFCHSLCVNRRCSRGPSEPWGPDHCRFGAGGRQLPRCCSS